MITAGILQWLAASFVFAFGVVLGRALERRSRDHGALRGRYVA
jgi:hypothetical protein